MSLRSLLKEEERLKGVGLGRLVRNRLGECRRAGWVEAGLNGADVEWGRAQTPHMSQGSSNPRSPPTSVTSPPMSSSSRKPKQP
jgi:hypothetical protein